MASGKMSRTKGKVGEREWAAKLREHGFDARRGVQHAGGPDSPDVVVENMPGFHAEVKRVEKLNLWSSIEQAIGDAPDGAVPYVAHRPNRREWVVVLRGEDFLRMCAQLLKPVHNPLK